MSETVEKPKVVVVMPAYNAAKTLRLTYDAIPKEDVDHMILVDDASRDETLQVARELKLEVFVHGRNYGYGGNQKTCYTEALKAGADIVVMLHPDYQYDPRRERPTLFWDLVLCREMWSSKECPGGSSWATDF